MRHPHPFILAPVAVAALLGSFVAFGQQTPKQQGLADAQVRQLVTKYRDEWLAKSTSEDVSVLARSTIVSVERQPQGWHITFMTPTGHSPATPEGIHDYYLHVYITPSGELDRIVRGPDMLSYVSSGGQREQTSPETGVPRASVSVYHTHPRCAWGGRGVAQA